ncbi:hypothetical protein J4207_06215, partial [Candidatus Woesearchaeota archaeon]|nr:hypothetical protein [Candidatus Woesearchaeota archaeon]
LADSCVKEGQYNYAIKACQLTNNNELLNKIGERCMKEGLLNAALDAYSLAGNDMMVQFIRENFRAV